MHTTEVAYIRTPAQKRVGVAIYGLINGDAWQDPRLSVVHLRVLMHLGLARPNAWRGLDRKAIRCRMSCDLDDRWLDMAIRQLVDWEYIDRLPGDVDLYRIRVGGK